MAADQFGRYPMKKIIQRKRPFLIAEIGINHNGDLNIAKKLISAAADAKFDAVKFQKRDNKTLLSDKQYRGKHPVPHNSFGKTYGEHREYLEFSTSAHQKILEYCEKRKIKYSCSAWDVKSAKDLSKICKQYIKVPSATNLNFEVLDFLCLKYSGDIHISTGMTTANEIDEILIQKHQDMS